MSRFTVEFQNRFGSTDIFEEVDDYELEQWEQDGYERLVAELTAEVEAVEDEYSPGNAEVNCRAEAFLILSNDVCVEETIGMLIDCYHELEEDEIVDIVNDVFDSKF